MQTPIRNILFLIIMALSLQALVACSDDAIVSGGYDEGKTSIELMVGGVGEGNAARSRAITKDPEDVAKRGVLPAGTALYMVMKSEDASSKLLYSVTKGVTGTADAKKISPIDFTETGCTRYWDDCFARNANLTIYAACSPGSTKVIKIGGKKNESDYPWTTLPTTGAWSNTAISPKIANWTVSENQTAETLRDEDLCYSNNISEYTKESVHYDKRLKFNSGTRKFDHGNLCFYHALSWITFEIIRDEESFTAEEFQFATGTNIKLTNFFTENPLFDISTGEFKADAYSSQTIQTMAKRATATTGSAFTLDALVLPTTDMSSTTKDDIHLIIANNEYNLSKKELLDKIQASDKANHLIGGTQLKPGVHYVFKLRIGKTKIKDITATILDWETVTADTHTPSNAKVTLNLEARGTKVDAYIYRAAETTTKITGDILSEAGKGYVWEKGYEGPNAYSASGDTLKSTWYWPDNKTFYHFRAIAPQSDLLAPTTVDGKDCVALTSGDSPYTDVCWGAPFPKMEPSTKFVYSLTNGFAGTDGHQIHYAIGATESPLKLLLFHVMSDVTFKISSVKGEAKVALGDGTSTKTKTKIELKNIYTAGRVQLGNGLVLGTGKQTQTHTLLSQGDTTLTWSNYGAIPQSLAGVVLEITTPDHNHYLIDLASVKASPSYISSKNLQNPYAIVDGKCTINRWYPDYKYTYSFTLSKKGVTGITCTILDWEEVSADDEEIQIK